MKIFEVIVISKCDIRSWMKTTQAGKLLACLGSFVHEGGLKICKYERVKVTSYWTCTLRKSIWISGMRCDWPGLRRLGAWLGEACFRGVVASKRLGNSGPPTSPQIKVECHDAVFGGEPTQLAIVHWAASKLDQWL